MTKDFWNQRYAENGFAYGAEPNVFLEHHLRNMKQIGQALFAAEGEGRNAIFAAKLGWDVTAFDLSEAGKTKALELAEQNGVQLNYLVDDLQCLDFEAEKFDLLVLIYAHFPAALKSAFHQKLARSLKPGGFVIFEAFSKSHLQYNLENSSAGGPRDIDMLFSLDEIAADFEGFEQLLLQESIITNHEGKYHVGQSSVIQFIGQKQ